MHVVVNVIAFGSVSVQLIYSIQSDIHSGVSELSVLVHQQTFIKIERMVCLSKRVHSSTPT